MGEVIDFKLKKYKVELEEREGQDIIEQGIVTVWEALDGISIRPYTDDATYLLVFLQFSGLCFELLEDEIMNVHEDDTVTMPEEVKETLLNAIKDIKGKLATNDNTTH